MGVWAALHLPCSSLLPALPSSRTTPAPAKVSWRRSIASAASSGTRGLTLLGLSWQVGSNISGLCQPYRHIVGHPTLYDSLDPGLFKCIYILIQGGKRYKGCSNKRKTQKANRSLPGFWSQTLSPHSLACHRCKFGWLGVVLGAGPFSTGVAKTPSPKGPLWGALLPGLLWLLLCKL